MDFPNSEFRHGFEEKIPNTDVKLLSNPPRLTPIREKYVMSLNWKDRYFYNHLLERYGEGTFVRGYLDAGRINRLFNRQIVPAFPENFNNVSREALLRVTYLDYL